MTSVPFRSGVVVFFDVMLSFPLATKMFQFGQVVSCLFVNVASG